MAQDPAGRFRSHKTYVQALAWIGGRRLFTTHLSALTDLATRVAASGVASDAHPGQIDLAQVQRCLRNAWSTEVLLALPAQLTNEDEFLRLANSWGVIQAYYVGYHVTQALIVAKGGVRPTTHPQTQRQYASLWVDRPLDLPPWTFGAASSGWKNKPANESIDLTVHSWSSCDDSNCWSLAGKVLASTRDDEVRAAIGRKRDQGQLQRKRTWQAAEAARLVAGRKPRQQPTFARPQLTSAEKAACDAGVRTYTFLDYLWRLRIGSNYDDAAVFVDGPDNDTDSDIVQRRMAFLASGSALLAEARIGQLVGRITLGKWADEFIAGSIPQPYSLGIKERRQFL